MTSYTSPLGFPYPDGGDSLHAAVTVIPKQLAEAVDDYLAALTAVGPVNWTNVATAGWGGTVAYARRAGMVTVNLEVTLAAFNPGDGIATMPAGFRPTHNVRATGEYGGDLRPFVIDSTGLISVSGSGTKSGGIYGSVTYPV